jgi:hypothetical protein
MYKWKVVFQAAGLETDFTKLPERINEAEKAIRTRLLNPGQPDDMERLEIDDAKRSLGALRRDLRR